MTRIKNLNLKRKIGLILLILVFILAVVATVPVATMHANADVNDYDDSYSCIVSTNSYILDDNTGYKIKGKTPSSYHPLGKKFAEISINVNTPNGDVTSEGTRTVDGKIINQYGIVAGEELAETANLIDIRLQYNFSDTDPIAKGWSISDDTALSIDEYDRIGEIKSGALIISKSYDGRNWEWQREGYSDQLKNNFHTTDFTANFAPFRYHEDSAVTIYTPAGKDLARGVYLKVLFAYEIKKEHTRKVDSRWEWLVGPKYETYWEYKNIVEESVFYLASNSAEVAFTNISQDNEPTYDSVSEMVQQAGSILSGHGSLKGFRINKLENSSFDIQYRIKKPNCEASKYEVAEDGQFFSETGRYDFKVTTSLGRVREYSIFVNNLDVNGAVNLYFGDPQLRTDYGLITSDSKRVYSMEDAIPVFVAGQTHYKINAVDQAYMPVAGKIKNIDTGKTIPIEGDYSEKTGDILEPGNYEADFYSNKDYEGEMSGDAYHFVFKFKVLSQDDVLGPAINQKLLNNMIGFADLRSSYYSVSVPTKGIGNAIFAFAEYSSAFGFAYEYERNKIDATQDGYRYCGVDYASQFEVLDKVNENAKLLVVKRYIDPSDSNTYTTLEEPINDVSELDFSFDVIVFRSVADRNAMKIGEPLLNDRVYRSVTVNGEPVKKVYPVKFIQVSDFESNSITLKHVEKGYEYSIEYNVSVEQQLQAVNAPSGRYQIIETTKGNDVAVYYANYIKYGDVKAKIDIAQFYNGEYSNRSYDISDDNLQTTVNAFVLNSAGNQYDSQTIVKVLKDGQQVFLGRVDEIDGQAYSTEGHYTITLIDRLNNSFSVDFNIYADTESSIYTFDIDGELKSQAVFNGQQVELKTLDNKPGMIFIGWEMNGTIYNDSYLVRSQEDLTFTAVWYYENVKISVYDGELYAQYSQSVGDKLVLPNLKKDGFTLVGFYYGESENFGRFYIGQISSVPNVPELRLDAIWKKSVVINELEKGSDGQSAITLINGDEITVIYADYGSEVSLPCVGLEGFEFFGWQYAKGQSAGTIYTAGKISEVPSVDSIVLYALFKSAEKQNTQGANAALAGTTSDSVGGSPIGLSDAGFGAVLVASASILVAMVWAFLKLQKKRNPQNSFAVQETNSSLNEQKKEKTVTACADIHNRTKKRLHFWNLRGTNSGVSYKNRSKIFVTAVCSLMAVVFGVQCLCQDFSAAVQNISLHNQAVTALAANNNSDSNVSLFSGLLNEEAHEGLSEDESVLLAVVMSDYVSLGYDVFPATVNVDHNSIEGIAYTTRKDFYTTENGTVYYSSGFVALPNLDEEYFIDWEDEDVIIRPISNENVDSRYGYIYSVEESYVNHYIANDRYVVYSVEYSVIDYYIYENNVENFDLSLGKIYNYDLDRVVYDPDLGYNSQGFSAQSLNNFTDYELATNYFRSYITEQNNKGLEVNTITSAYISYAALNEWKLNNQDESFLGISAEEIYEFESSLSITEYYVVAFNPETGENELTRVEFPPPPPDPPGFFQSVLNFLNDWAGKIASLGLIIGGLIVTCVAGPVAGGAMLGAGMELFTQCFVEGKKLTEVNWLKVGVATLAGAIAGTGIGIGAAALIGGGLFALESIIEHADRLDSAEAWFEIGMDFLDGFQRNLAIGSLVSNPVFCFVAGTGIATLNGIKKIENIRKGDLVASWNSENHTIEYKPVKQLFVNQTEELTHVKTSNGDEIVSTPTHPYYVVNKSYYVDAKNLRAGDILQTVNGKRVVVEQVQHELLELPVSVYNFEVEENHNYFVGNSLRSGNGDFVLTHNLCSSAATSQGITSTGGTIDWTAVGKNITDALTRWAPKVGALGVTAGMLARSAVFCEVKSDTKAKDEALTDEKEHKPEVHHIVAQHAALAQLSRDILKAADIKINDPINLVTLNYDQHRHLHTNRYHARVLMDMLGACKRALKNTNMDSYIEKLRDIIEDATSKPASIRKKIKEVVDAIGNYFKEFDDPVAQSNLKTEVTITLNAIRMALFNQTYII